MATYRLHGVNVYGFSVKITNLAIWLNCTKKEGLKPS